LSADEIDKRPNRLRFAPALAAVAACTLLLAWFATSWFRNTAPAAIEGVALTEFVGLPVFLFNGTTLDPKQPFTGKWLIEQGAEQGNVLAGDGTRTFKCLATDGHAMKFFSFRTGFLHHHADVVELQLATDSGGELAKIVIDKDSAKLFAAGGEAHAAPPVPLPKFDGDSQGYFSVQIERHVNYCEGFVEGQSLGRIATEDFSPAQVTVSVTGSGSAHFEGIQVSEFESPDAAIE